MSKARHTKEEEKEVSVDEEEEGVEEEEVESGEQDDESLVVPPWQGLLKFQEKNEIVNVIRKLKDAGKKQLSILLLGKSSVGKSSTVNTLLGETVARVQAMKLQPEKDTLTLYARQVSIRDPHIDGFKIKVYDTCGLEDAESGDSVNYEALRSIAEELRGKPIDVVLYTDRLDLYRVEPLDQAIMRAVVDTFGKRVLRRTALLLTHSHVPQTPPGTTYASFKDRRVQLLRRALAAEPPIPIPFLRRPSIPAVFAEHAPHCPVSARRRRILPDGTEWVAALFEQISSVALSEPKPYRYHPRLSQDPSQRFAWLMPVILLAQAVLFKQVLGPYVSSRLDEHYQNYRRRIDEENEEGRRMSLPDIRVPEEADFWRMQSGQGQQQE